MRISCHHPWAGCDVAKNNYEINSHSPIDCCIALPTTLFQPHSSHHYSLGMIKRQLPPESSWIKNRSHEMPTLGLQLFLYILSEFSGSSQTVASLTPASPSSRLPAIRRPSCQSTRYNFSGFHPSSHHRSPIDCCLSFSVTFLYNPDCPFWPTRQSDRSVSPPPLEFTVRDHRSLDGRFHYRILSVLIWLALCRFKFTFSVRFSLIRYEFKNASRQSNIRILNSLTFSIVPITAVFVIGSYLFSNPIHPPSFCFHV